MKLELCGPQLSYRLGAPPCRVSQTLPLPCRCPTSISSNRLTTRRSLRPICGPSCPGTTRGLVRYVQVRWRKSVRKKDHFHRENIALSQRRVPPTHEMLVNPMKYLSGWWFGFFVFPYIGFLLISTDELIFSEGWLNHQPDKS